MAHTRGSGTAIAVTLKTISGLNGSPTQWDDGWQLFTDLSPAQIAAYQAMPEWQAFVASYNDWVANRVGDAPSLTVGVVQQAQATAMANAAKIVP